MEPIVNTEVLSKIEWPNTSFNVVKQSILIGYRGSQAHGTWVAPSEPNSIDDIDVMSVVICKETNYIGLDNWEGCEGINDPWDCLIYDIKKFFNLLVKQNPNVLTMLWLEPENYLYLTSIGATLVNEREMFSSRSCFEQFKGYAIGQLHRMTHVAGRGYLGAKRKELVKKHGFDTKNASHLIRLLHMGIEFLETGKLNVKRTWDRELLMDIKRGKYTLVDINEMASDAFAKLDEAVKKSPLPPKLDLKKINNLCANIIKDWFCWNE